MLAHVDAKHLDGIEGKIVNVFIEAHAGPRGMGADANAVHAARHGDDVRGGCAGLKLRGLGRFQAVDEDVALGRAAFESGEEEKAGGIAPIAQIGEFFLRPLVVVFRDDESVEALS